MEGGRATREEVAELHGEARGGTRGIGHWGSVQVWSRRSWPPVAARERSGRREEKQRREVGEDDDVDRAGGSGRWSRLRAETDEARDQGNRLPGGGKGEKRGRGR